MKTDFHVHTCYSMDCSSSLEEIIERCLKLDISCLAIADHGTIKGAIEMKKISPFPIIVAEEILTPDGEIMGMFLEHEIPSPISSLEAIRLIKEQGGFVCIPHPYDLMRSSAFNSDKLLEKLMPSVDIVEVFNSRSLDPRSEAKARRLLTKYDKLASAGSDAHTPGEIGNAYVEMPPFDSKLRFLESLSHGKVIGRKSSPLVHLISTTNKLTKRFSAGK